MKPDHLTTEEWLATDPPLDEVLAAQAEFRKRADTTIKRAGLTAMQEFLEVDPYPEQPKDTDA